MNRNGIAREGIHSKQIKVLWRLAFQRQARIAQLERNAGLRVAQKSEVLPRDSHDQRIDFVERELITFVAIRRDRAGAEANHANAPSAARSQSREGLADSRVSAVVRHRQIAPRCSKELETMGDGSVHEPAESQIIFGAG